MSVYNIILLLFNMHHNDYNYLYIVTLVFIVITLNAYNIGIILKDGLEVCTRLNYMFAVYLVRSIV